MAVTLYITVTLQFPKGDWFDCISVFLCVSLHTYQSAKQRPEFCTEHKVCIFIIIILFIMIVEWYWKVWLCPWLLRITAVLLFLLSVTLVWSEVTFFNNEPVLSIFALMIDGASVGYYYFYVEVCQTNL